ncbi:hypothetical protein AK88_05011 [Plasmodium fragile]|uniref:Tr-type G domain-containing protein n=1 Tax=Plasmodium fragile TaxID=5857 RepID=A0A0D9QE62_PLAFR|nr:uncharacterized protein AK88_05011 [Plasmodium fragile]KJP85350.1 hypothetical protein AK88_05011 [Plasmodium fragile]
MINVNVGVLGHVDSGKTSLCRCLSEVLSTCALDKHRQSQERGITIDLGFSSFYLKRRRSQRGAQESDSHSEEVKTGDILNGKRCDEERGDGEVTTGEGSAGPLNCSPPEEETLQVCLVDCPGHHSLLNCIIMGAEITDMVLLLIDITKGIQKQTVECLVLCEVLQRDIVVVLNKIDLVPPEQRKTRVNLMKDKIELVFRSKPGLRNLKWYVVGLSADSKRAAQVTATGDALTSTPPTDSHAHHVRGSDCGASASPPRSENVRQLINLLKEVIRVPARRGNRPRAGGGGSGSGDEDEDEGEGQPRNHPDEFYFLYDHTFDVKGKGRVYTGTVIRGTITKNTTVSILPMKEKGKVKAIQSFKQTVDEGTQGNRLSLLICNDHIRSTGKKTERGVIVTEFSNISHFTTFICRVKLVQYYGRSVNSGELLSCVIGFSTSPCYGYFFRPINNHKTTGGENPSQHNNTNKKKKFDPKGNYLLINQLTYKQEKENKEEEEEEEEEEEKKKKKTSTDNLNSNEYNTKDIENKNPTSDEDIFFLVMLKKKIHCYTKEKCIFIKNEENLNCRICLHGIIEDIVDHGYPQQKAPFIVGKKPTLHDFPRFNSFKLLTQKRKVGQIERIQDNHTVICKNMFQCSTQVTPYMRQQVCLVHAGHKNDVSDVHVRYVGVVTAPFAKNGKFIAHFEDDLSSVKENYKSFLLLINYYKDALTKRKVFL